MKVVGTVGSLQNPNTPTARTTATMPAPCNTSVLVGRTRTGVPWSRCSAIQPPRSSPKVPMVAMAAALRPQRPSSRSKLSSGMNDQAEQRAQQRGERGRSPSPPAAGAPKSRSRLKGTRPPVPQMPGTQRRSARIVITAWKTVSSERNERVTPPSVRSRTTTVETESRTMSSTPRPTGAAGEPDHGDAGSGPHQPDVLGLDDGEPSEQAGADVCRQPCDCPGPGAQTLSFSRPHGFSIVGKGPPREAGTAH